MKPSRPIKTILAACAIAAPLLASNLCAQTGATWNPGSADPGLWSNPANWGGSVPVSGFKAFLNVSGVGPCVVDSAVGGCQIAIGDGGPGTLIVTNGGDLSAGDTGFGDLGNNGWTVIGNTGGDGTLIVENGGNLHFNFHMFIASLNNTATGTLIMNGGTASVTNNGDANWQVGTPTGPASRIQMNGGTLFVRKWDAGRIQGSSRLDLAGGKVIVTDGDRVANIQAEITAGKITAHNGSGTVSVDFNTTTPGATTIMASGGGGGGDNCGTINNFDNASLGGTYGSWSTPLSTSSNLQITATGFGGGFAAVTPVLSTSSNRTLSLDVTLTGLGIEVVGPIVVLQDGDGTQLQYAFYNTVNGHQVLTAPLSSGAVVPAQPGTVAGFDFSTISFIQLQLDPQALAGAYTIAFNDLSVTGCSGGSGASQINSISVDGGNVTIKYSTTAGATYHVEATAEFSPTAWSPVGGTTSTGSGGEDTATFPVGDDTAFYRIASP